MKFLFLTQYFAPEVGAAPLRLGSIIRQLRELGHEVEVITGMPNYPVGRIFDGYRNKFYTRDLWHGVPVHRVWLYAAAGKGLARVFNYGTFTLLCLFGLFRAKRADCLFVESPPLSLSVPAFVYSRLYGVPFVFYVADLWPDAMRDNLGLEQDGLVLKLARALERWSYRKAAYVCTVTEGIVSELQERGVALSKLLFLPNGVDLDQFAPMGPDEELREELGLRDKHVIVYAGTHGFAHGIDRILEAAKILQERDGRFQFIFVGDGSAKAELQKQSVRLGLQNVRFLDPIAPDEVTRLFSIALCGIVSLNESRISQHTRPVKSLATMSCGRPVLYVGSGEGASLVEHAEAGLVIHNREPEGIADAVCQLSADPCLARRLGENGRRFIEERLSWATLVKRCVNDLSRRMSLSESEAQQTLGARQRI